MQTKKGSAFEVLCNTVSGILLAMCAWNYIVVPLLNTGFNYSEVHNNFLITIIFAGISIIRGFFWRRLFTWLEFKGIVK